MFQSANNSSDNGTIICRATGIGFAIDWAIVPDAELSFFVSIQPATVEFNIELSVRQLLVFIIV
jgi:hypothetical protein